MTDNNIPRKLISFDESLIKKPRKLISFDESLIKKDNNEEKTSIPNFVNDNIIDTSNNSEINNADYKDRYQNKILRNIGDSTHLIIEDKISDLIKYTDQDIFKHCKNEYKKTYINDIRKIHTEMLEEAVRYRVSSSISHIYNVDVKKEVALHFFNILEKLDPTFSKDQLNTVNNKMREIGKMCGGISKARNKKDKNKKKKAYPNRNVKTSYNGNTSNESTD